MSATSWWRRLQDPRAHRYSNSRGIPGLRKALAAYYARRFNVEIDPETRGDRRPWVEGRPRQSRPGHHQPGRCDPGAQSLLSRSTPSASSSLAPPSARSPSIPVPTSWRCDGPRRAPFRAEAARCHRQLPQQSDGAKWRPSISTARSSPSAASTSIFIISDIAYAEVYFDGAPPPSILEVPAPRRSRSSSHPSSKTYSMPGWRIGFCVGNQRLIGALTRVKSYLDYGAFTPIQVAATAALNGPAGMHRRDARPL